MITLTMESYERLDASGYAMKFSKMNLDNVPPFNGSEADRYEIIYTFYKNNPKCLFSWETPEEKAKEAVENGRLTDTTLIGKTKDVVEEVWADEVIDNMRLFEGNEMGFYNPYADMTKAEWKELNRMIEEALFGNA